MPSTDGEPERPDPDLTVVVPVWNNASTIAALTEAVLDEMSHSDWSHEVVLVDDASTDDSWSRIVELATAHPVVRGIGLAHNGGAGTARAAGCSVARGRWICMIDGDLDYDPRDLPAVVELLEQGNDFVSGVRVDPGGRPVLRRVGSWLLQLTVRSVWSFTPRDLGCGLQGWTAELAEQGLPHLATHRDMAWAVPLLRPVRRYAEVPVHEVSSGRESSYGALRLTARLWNLLRATRPWVPPASVCLGTAVSVVLAAAGVRAQERARSRPILLVAVLAAGYTVRSVRAQRSVLREPPFEIDRRVGD